MPLSDRTKALLERKVRPGEHSLEFHARWGTEIETGEMSREAARYWSQDQRQDLLRPGYCSMEDVMDEWDDAEHGERPAKGSEAWLEEDVLCGECTFVYMDPVLLLPAQGFFVHALAAAEEGDREEDRRAVPLNELLSEKDIADFKVVSEAAIYPDPAPSTWCSTNCWKGNHGQCTISVAEEATLREVLRAQPLGANVWVEVHGEGNGWKGTSSSTAHFEDINVGEDGYVEWENLNGKSSELEVTPPDNMRLWRVTGIAIGRFMCMLRRATERVYAPGGPGVETVRREFERLAAELMPSERQESTDE
jgi:hypothetical protein